jgi:hypothetical protein
MTFLLGDGTNPLRSGFVCNNCGSWSPDAPFYTAWIDCNGMPQDGCIGGRSDHRVQERITPSEEMPRRIGGAFLASSGAARPTTSTAERK